MQIVAFEANGMLRYGVLKDDAIVEPDPSILARYPDVRRLLEQQAVTALAKAVEGKQPALRLKDAKLAPPVHNPKKIFCVGLNYKSHVSETKRPDATYPSIFMRFADSLTAHDQPMLMPFQLSNMIDFEGELAVIIGKGGRNITQADAWSHIAGYACFNDGTVRDWQRHTHQWSPGKNFPNTGALGPALVTTDEVGNVNGLTLTTRLNGQVMQEGSLSDLIFPIPLIIEYLSTFTPLSAGDVIATGTPGGVGDRRQPPVYMKAGDTVEVEITRVGTLRNIVTPV
jgi:2-keto-4-pentenoate hydratase/2-oxohepta-3-ene-1,7-dioic acid hydratase in catechol pathway